MEFEIFKIGGHEGTRTPNFLLVREAVYQLTYMPENLLFFQQTARLFQKNSLIFFKRANCKITKIRLCLSSLADDFFPFNNFFFAMSVL